MVLSLLLVPIFSVASTGTRQPANNSEWDLLYCAATMAFVVLLVVGLATFLNRRDDRRA